MTAKPMIYDTDMGSDDWLAALFLLRHPEVDLKAITVTGAGLAHVEFGTRHALSLAALTGRPALEVAGGRETPLTGTNVFPASWREASDRLSGLKLPDGGKESNRSAVDVILSLSRSFDRELTVVATGPLTNVAEALRADPTLSERVRMVYVMGGAVKVPGNVHATCPELPNRTAEWNFYIDPIAAKEVVASGIPVTLVPLDATDAVPVTIAFYDLLRERLFTPIAEFAFNILEQRYSDIINRKYFFWDSLAAVVAVDESCTSVAEFPVTVETNPTFEGQVRPDAEGSIVRVCQGADLAKFQRLYLDAITAG